MGPAEFTRLWPGIINSREPFVSGQVPRGVLVDLDLRVVIQRPIFACAFHKSHFLVCRSDHSERYQVYFIVPADLVPVTQQTFFRMNDLEDHAQVQKDARGEVRGTDKFGIMWEHLIIVFLRSRRTRRVAGSSLQPFCCFCSRTVGSSALEF